MNAHLTNSRPVEIGRNVAEIEALAISVSRLAAAYRVYPNFPIPEIQEAKAGFYARYQAALAELLEAVNRG